jgi:small-conductance mechanosensitive channel
LAEKRGKMSLKVKAFTLSIGFMIIYIICVAWDLAFPEYAMYQVWAPLFPGFTWLSLSSFLLGLFEAFIYGLLIAVIFVPLNNFFNKRFEEPTRPPKMEEKVKVTN